VHKTQKWRENKENTVFRFLSMSNFNKSDTSKLPTTWVTIVSTALATATAYYTIESLLTRLQARSPSPRHQPDKPGSKLGKPLASTASEKYGGCVYMDYNATTPIFPEVQAAMEPFTWACFGNPSSPHVYATPCREAVASARVHVSDLIGAEATECIVFTSCGTESDNRAIDIALHQYQATHKRLRHGGAVPTPHVISCTIEHPAVLMYLHHLERTKIITLSVVEVDKEGCVVVADIEKELQAHMHNTALVSIMHSNNEVGSIQPVRGISAIIRRFNAAHKGTHRVLFHSDAAQSIGKVAVDVSQLGVDLLTIVGHKLGAPKGIAALYIKQDILHPVNKTASTQHPSTSTEPSHWHFAPLQPMLFGGGQESGLRGGTENVILIVGLGEACRVARLEARETLLHMLALKLRLIQALASGLKEYGADFLKFNGPERACNSTEILSDIGMLKLILKPLSPSMSNSSASESGHPSEQESKAERDKDATSFARTCASLVEQLPNTVSVSFKGVRVTKLMPLLTSKVACSAGSACHVVDFAADDRKLSPVLAAMKVDPEYGLGTLRLSLGRHTCKEDIDLSVQHIIAALASLKS